MSTPGPSRIRPTASNRRSGRAPSNTPEIEEEVQENADDRDEESIELSGPFPGGPVDISILRSFKTHIAADIWYNEEREPLKPQSHTAKLNEWAWVENTHNHHFQRYIDQSGLRGLVHISHQKINRILVSSFVERWQPETNTFHMSYGEMTITLDDVSTLISIPVVGRSVSPPTVDDPTDLVMRTLGVTRRAAEDELEQIRGKSVRLEWLRANFSIVTDADTEVRIQSAARAYLLYLVGCTLFSDKSGTRVSISYLRLFEDLGDVSKFAWGTTALAILYRQLGYASRSGVRQIAGYLPLLQTWIYEHFPIVRPPHNTAYTTDLPRACMWASHGSAGSSLEKLRAVRESLDCLRADEVVWNPYQDSRDHHPLYDISFFTGCIKCMDVIEPYHPERVLRQFGRIQIIPHTPIPPATVRRGYIALQYRLSFTCIDHFWERWRSHLLSEEERSVPATYPWEAVNGYIDWYHSISHPVVQNPAHRFAGAPGGTLVTVVSPAVLMERVSHALQLCEPTIRRGVMGEHTIHDLYNTVYNIKQALEGGVEPMRDRDFTSTYDRRGRRPRNN